MEPPKMFLYILLAVILIYMLIKSCRLLFMSENYDNTTTTSSISDSAASISDSAASGISDSAASISDSAASISDSAASSISDSAASISDSAASSISDSAASISDSAASSISDSAATLTNNLDTSSNTQISPYVVNNLKESTVNNEKTNKSPILNVIDSIKSIASNKPSNNTTSNKQNNTIDTSAETIDQTTISDTLAELETPQSTQPITTKPSYTTQQSQVRSDPIIEPKYFDSSSDTVIDGVKVIPHSLSSPWANAYMKQSNNYMLDTGHRNKNNYDNGTMRFTKRSPACCSPTYPPPFKIRVDPTICKDKKNYVPSPYTGNDNWTNAGCACVTKQNILNLAHRGGNA